MDHVLNHEDLALVEGTSSSPYTFYSETILFSGLFLLSLTLNLPLLVVYARSKHTRSVADKFLSNMLIADALCVLVLLPSILVDLLLPEGQETDVRLSRASVAEALVPGQGSGLGSNSSQLPVVLTEFRLVEEAVMYVAGGSWTCAFKKSLLSGVSTASILAALEIAVERYLAVVNPLHYHEFLTGNGVLTTSVIGTVIASGSAVLSSFDPCQPIFPGCVRSTVTYTDSLWWPVYTLVHVTLFFLLPVLLMVFIYIKIWWEARRQRAKMTANPFFVNVPHYGDRTHNTVEDPQKAKHRFHVHPILLRFKLIDRLVAPRMDRAARVAICTLFVSICCWGPYNFVEASHAFTSIMRQLGGRVHVLEDWYHFETILPLLFASLHPVVAPFFYAYRYKRLRQEVLKTCHLDGLRCLSRKNGGCPSLPPKRVLLDYHEAVGRSKSPVLTASSSEVGIHSGASLPPPCPTPPSTPPIPKFQIGPDPELETLEAGTLTEVIVEGPASAHLTLPSPNTLSSLLTALGLWWHNYYGRWGSHRESVTSNSSVVTLLSPRSMSRDGVLTATHV